MAVAFGTDGIRGAANVELTAEVALSLGRAACGVLGTGTWLIGADTRASGPMLVAALAAGLASAGADVVDLGVLPTPGVAFHAQARGCPAAVVSASHNPWTDNGIKLLATGGRKLTDALEHAIAVNLTAPDRRPSSAVGRIARAADPVRPYVEHLVAALEGRRLDGMRVVLDCANGAASAIAPRVLAEVGASVTALHDAPDGVNINDGCGSTDPSELARVVAESGADLGLALDGDADRVIAVDGAGEIVDGDVLLAMFALDLAGRGELSANTVAVTVMTNLGFRLAMEARDIAVLETDVGDRHVLAALDAGGLTLGGEQSGHIIFRSLSTTGDGVLTGLALADLMVRRGEGLATLAAGLVERVPQRLVNVRVAKPERLADCAEVWEAVVKAEAELGHAGRVLLRPSGTEPMVRVMVESREAGQADAVAAQLAGIVKGALGGE